MSIFYAKDSVEFELAKALGIGVAFEAEGDNINQPVNSNKAQSQNQTKSNFNSNLSSNNSINSAVNEVENINLTGDPEKDYQIIVDVLTKKTNYGQFIGELKDITKDPKLLKIFRSKYGNSDYREAGVSAEPISLPVANLHPTQSEIDFTKSVANPLQDKYGSLNSWYSGNTITVGGPIITYNKKWIIDGHHRWSQLFCMNTKAMIECINFTYSNVKDPLQVLRNFQGAVVAGSGQIKEVSVEKGENLYDLIKNDKILVDKINKVMTDKAIAIISNHIKEVTDRLTASKFIAVNCKKLPKPNPGSPSRVLMPQTGEEEGPVMKIAKKGQTNL